MLNGEKADSSAPEVEAMVETTLQYAGTATKSMIAKNIQNKRISGDKVFLLATISITIIILLSVPTGPSIMDYVDINGLGVDSKFTILTLLTLLINCVSLALLARRYLKAVSSKEKANDFIR